MKRFILILFAFGIIFNSFSQVRPTKKVRKAFEAKYAGAEDVSWTKDGDRAKDIEYRADYKLDGDEMRSTFDYYGNWEITVIFIEIDELPETVTKAIYEEYMNAKIIKAARLEEPELSSFGVSMDYMDSKMELQIREDGRVVRRRLRSEGFDL